MHDLKALRENPDAFDRAWARLGVEPASAGVLAIDERRRALLTELQEWEASRNRLSKDIGQLKRDGGDASSAMDQVAQLKTRIQDGREHERQLEVEISDILAGLPNLPAAEVPDGPDESANRELRRWGEPRGFEFKVRDHVDLGQPLGLDFERSAKLSGARFVIGIGKIARLERALGQFMLDLQTKQHGYTEVLVPLLVRDNAVYGTGQLPKFAEDLFQTTSGHWLIPTAEVPLTNLVADQVLDAADLPLRLTALTPCFRSEAGSAGRDTRGMIRVHQFYKVEMVSITAPDRSTEEHDRMTACAEAVLQALELPYRVLSLCTGDLGFASTITYDLEAWMPSQQTFREISSCSNCGAFQARRMNARMRGADNKRVHVHTLNGSGVAVGRALVMLLENHQQADGSIAIPPALRSYLDDLEYLHPDA